MAMTSFGTNAAQTVKLWSKLTMRETLKGTLHFKRLLGKGTKAVIQNLTDLEKTAGDQIKYDLLMQADGDGVTGSSRLKDNEEPLVYYQDSVKIDQLRNAHGFYRLSQQMTVHDLRKDASANMADWFSGKLESYMMRYLAGDTTINHGQAGTAPDAAHQSICGNQANEAAITSNDKLTLEELSYAKEKAVTADPEIRPVRIEGRDYFVALVHPYCVTDLRLTLGSANAVNWINIQQYANQRGLKNPIFTGAKQIYAYGSHLGNKVKKQLRELLETVFDTISSQARICYA